MHAMKHPSNASQQQGPSMKPLTSPVDLHQSEKEDENSSFWMKQITSMKNLTKQKQTAVLETEEGKKQSSIQSKSQNNQSS
jgi:hypothetical protein